MNESATNPGVRWIEIDDEHAGQRIDNFLFARLKGVPKSLIYRILRSGEVRRNGGRIKPLDRLSAGDRLRIPPIRISEGTAPVEASPKLSGQIESRILLEDSDLLVLNKPSGLAVHGGSGLSFGLIEALRAIRPEAKHLELVHRLDRETSGCLLIAKRRSALKSLHDQFRDDEVSKVYLALVHGKWSKRADRIEAPLRKNVLKSGERVVVVARDGKPAVTDFRRIRAFDQATLVEARPVTGRTHQIRVHAQSMGHPLCGDERYAPEEANRCLRQLGLKRLFLHARETTFRHPRSGSETHVMAPLDPELQRFMDQLA